MFFESYKSIIFSDTSLPDLFISEYLPSMDGDCVKVYIYCLFLSKFMKQASTEELSKKLEIDLEKVKGSLTQLEALGIIIRKDDSIMLTDLKEKEINRLFRTKSTSTPEEAKASSERNKKRNSIVSAINNTFFQGVMSPSWYTDIDAWFDKFRFEEDVMYALFQHCYDNKGLSKQYISKVAENWHAKGIVNHLHLEKYSDDYRKFREIKGMIIKRLKLNRNLTRYEDEYVEKWVMEYGFSFDIIELALKKTTAKTSPNFEYIHTILSAWHREGLNSKEAILANMEAYKRSRKASASTPTGQGKAVPQQGNYNQRKYDDETLNSLYENTDG